MVSSQHETPWPSISIQWNSNSNSNTSFILKQECNACTSSSKHWWRLCCHSVWLTTQSSRRSEGAKKVAEQKKLTSEAVVENYRWCVDQKWNPQPKWSSFFEPFCKHQLECAEREEEKHAKRKERINKLGFAIKVMWSWQLFEDHEYRCQNKPCQ